MPIIQQCNSKTEQETEFCYDVFVTRQVRDSVNCIAGADFSLKTAVDIGGGFSFFTEALANKTGLHVQVVDVDLEVV